MSMMTRGIRVPVLGEVRIGDRIDQLQQLAARGQAPESSDALSIGGRTATWKLPKHTQLTMTEGTGYDYVQLTFNTGSRGLFSRLLGLSNSSATVSSRDGVVDRISLRLPGEKVRGKNVGYQLEIVDEDRSGRPDVVTLTRSDGPAGLAHVAVAPELTRLELRDTNGDGVAEVVTGEDFSWSPVPGDWLVR